MPSPTLPSELIEMIFLNLPTDDPTSIAVLTAARSVSHSVSAISQLDSVWLPHLQRWTIGSSRAVDESPYKFFKRRYTIDQEAARGIKRLVASVSHRVVILRDIVSLGLDAYDYLHRASEVNTTADSLDRLSSNYWSTEAVGMIMRSEAVKIWTAIAMQDEEEEDEDSFERGVLAFTYFRSGVPGRIERLYCEQSYRGELTEAASLEVIALDVMRRIQDLGVRAAIGDEFHLLDNHFLNLVLDRAADTASTSCPGTLPMTLVSIFCSIVRRLPFDLVARPIGFPGRVLAAVRRRTRSSADWIYIDVFDGRILSRSDFATSNGDVSLDRLLPPASAKDMCSRVAANIFNSTREPIGEQPIDLYHTCRYAAGSCRLALLGRGGVTQATLDLAPIVLLAIKHSFPRDADYVGQSILPLFQSIAPIHAMFTKLWTELIDQDAMIA